MTSSPPRSPTTAQHHQAPSLPNSPLAKRPKSDHTSATATTTISAAMPEAVPITASDAMPEIAPTPTAIASTSSPVTTDVSAAPPALLIKKLSPKAKTPTRGSAFAAGYDLYSAKATTIPAMGKALVDTDLAVAIPLGTYGRVAPRSGLASKHFLHTGAGVIDADYRGMVRVLLFNHSSIDYHVKEEERVAQLILERIYTPEVVEVEELDATVRGAGGFGSTG